MELELALLETHTSLLREQKGFHKHDVWMCSEKTPFERAIRACGLPCCEAAINVVCS
jgi:hypothetical protein